MASWVWRNRIRRDFIYFMVAGWVRDSYYNKNFLTGAMRQPDGSKIRKEKMTGNGVESVFLRYRNSFRAKISTLWRVGEFILGFRI